MIIVSSFSFIFMFDFLTLSIDFFLSSKNANLNIGCLIFIAYVSDEKSFVEPTPSYL